MRVLPVYVRFCWVALCVFVVASCGFAAPTSEPTRYLVSFKNVGDMPQNGGHAVVMRHLQRQLARQLGTLKKVLRKTDDIVELWIANAAAMTLTPAELKSVAAMPEVAAVRPVRYRRWIDRDIEKSPVQVTGRAVQWSVAKVGAPEVWDQLKLDGSGVVVGILDTGIAAAHPALAGKTLAWKDFTKTPKFEPYDDQGHGTHTAGSVCGGDGVGVAPGARLLVAKVFDRSGGADDAGLLGAMQWVMDPDGDPATNDGPQLVSNSWGSDDTTDRTFWTAVEAWVNAGILPVFAAGNNGPKGKVGTPGGFPHSWAVGATTKTDTIAYFSSVGPTVWDGQTLVKPDISAPGHGVISCSTSGGLVSNSGTSMACPHVSGLAALMYQANPKLTIEQVRTIAESTCVDLGTAGKDNTFGWGRFQALPAVKKALETATLGSSFAAYENALVAERSLIGVQAQAPLSAPLAKSIVTRSIGLDETTFGLVAAEVKAAGHAASLQLLADAVAQRKAAELNK